MVTPWRIHRKIKPCLPAELSLSRLPLLGSCGSCLGRVVSLHYWWQRLPALVMHGCNLWSRGNNCLPLLAQAWGEPLYPSFSPWSPMAYENSAGICCAGESGPWPFVLLTPPPSSHSLAVLANQLRGVWAVMLTRVRDPDTEGIIGFLNSFFPSKG